MLKFKRSPVPLIIGFCGGVVGVGISSVCVGVDVGTGVLAEEVG